MSSPHNTHNGVADATDEDAAESDRAHPSHESERARTGGPDEALAAIVARIGELREYAGYYIAANLDRLRLTGRAALMWAIFGIVIVAIGVAVVVAASVLLVVSLSTGVGELFGGRTWLGQLIVSATILLLASGGVWLALRLSLRNYQKSLIQKYELRKQEERTEYGTDVEQRRKSARKPRSQPSGDEYLANQISDARLALESTLDDLTLDLASAADLRRWVRRYPWAALGTALAAGFTLAYVVTKPKLKVNDAADSDEHAANDEIVEAAAIKPAKKSKASDVSSGWRTMLLGALFDILRLVVTQIISASVRQASSHAPPPPYTANDSAEVGNQKATPDT